MNLRSERTSAEVVICQSYNWLWFIKFKDLSRPMARMGGGVGQGGFAKSLNLLPFSQSEMNPAELGMVSQCQQKKLVEKVPSCGDLSQYRKEKDAGRIEEEEEDSTAQPRMTQDQMTQHRTTQHKTLGISQG